jgi:tRNA-2-methylthio-N6-dimethylallyladenosine synthase
MNKSDSERIAGYLEKHGYVLSENKDKADLVVMTTCGVRQSAEDRVYGLIPKIKKNNHRVKIILTGCLSERKDVRIRLKKYVDIWLPITELESLADKLKVKAQITDKKFGGSMDGYLKINPKYNSKFSAFVPIGNGCDNFCTYCVVPYARGREVYRDADEIVKEVESLVKNNYKEIILIAQNVNSYKSVKSKVRKVKSPADNIDFANLLKMVNDIPGDFWIRFATSHPKDMSDDLIKAIAECNLSASLKTGKVCEHIHLPAQAGDNEILKKMNRKYTVEHYIKLIKKIKKQIATNQKTNSHEFWQPPVSITTDIIVGFPGETKAQFNNTAKLFKAVKFDMAYISKYSPRYGTVSAKMEDNVPKTEKERREEELIKILKKTALENNKKYIGKAVEVLIEGKNKKGEWFGKTRTFKNVELRTLPTGRQVTNYECNFGEFVKVKINKVKDFRLSGDVVK